MITPIDLIASCMPLIRKEWRLLFLVFHRKIAYIYQLVSWTKTQ